MGCLRCPAAPVNQTFPFVVADWMSRILITEVDLLREYGNQIKNVCLEYKKLFSLHIWDLPILQQRWLCFGYNKR